MFVCDLRHDLEIGNVRMRISESLDKHKTRVLFERGLVLIDIVNVNKGRLDTKSRQRMSKQIDRAALDRLLRDNV